MMKFMWKKKEKKFTPNDKRVGADFTTSFVPSQVTDASA